MPSTPNQSAPRGHEATEKTYLRMALGHDLQLLIRRYADAHALPGNLPWHVEIYDRDGNDLDTLAVAAEPEWLIAALPTLAARAAALFAEHLAADASS